MLNCTIGVYIQEGISLLITIYICILYKIIFIFIIYNILTICVQLVLCFLNFIFPLIVFNCAKFVLICAAKHNFNWNYNGSHFCFHSFQLIFTDSRVIYVSYLFINYIGMDTTDNRCLPLITHYIIWLLFYIRF